MRVFTVHVAASMTTISFVLLTGTYTSAPSAVNTGSNAILPTGIDFTSAGFAGWARSNTSNCPETSVDPTSVLPSGDSGELHERVRRRRSPWTISTR